MSGLLETLGGLFSGLNRTLALGGPVVLILIAMSILALTIVVAKLLQFRRVRINDRRTARSALGVYRSGNAAGAVTMARRSPNPAARPGPCSALRWSLEAGTKRKLSSPSPLAACR